jgi:hypothetical protein
MARLAPNQTRRIEVGSYFEATPLIDYLPMFGYRRSQPIAGSTVKEEIVLGLSFSTGKPIK